MYSPTRYPAASSTDSSMAQVEPLPLVPATVNTGQSNARPSLSRTAFVRSSVMSIVRGCRRSQCASQSSRVRGRGWPGTAWSTRLHDFKKEGVPPEHLRRWIDAVGWDKVLNRQGTTWRRLDPAAQAAVADAGSAAALLLAQPSAIKRPVVEWPDGAVSVGFSADDWQRRLRA
jgi:arsenate reductase